MCSSVGLFDFSDINEAVFRIDSLKECGNLPGEFSEAR